MMENPSNDRRWSVHRARVTNDCYSFMLFWNGASFLNHFEPKSRWLFDSKEAPQSFQDYVMERPPAPQRAHNRIYLLPLTEAGGGHDKVGSLPDLRPLQRFIEAFFDLTCKVLPYDPLLTGKLGGGVTIFWHVFGLHVCPLWGVEFPIWSPLCQRKVKIPDVSHPKCKQEIWRAGHNRRSWLATYLHPSPLVRTIRGTRKIDKIWMCLRNCRSLFLGVAVQVSFQLATTYHSNLGKALLLDPTGMEMTYNTTLKTAYGNFGYVFRWMASAFWASLCVTCLIALIALYIAVCQFLGHWKESQGGQWRIMEDWGFGATSCGCNYSHPLCSIMKENYSILRLSCQHSKWPRNVKKPSEPH